MNSSHALFFISTNEVWGGSEKLWYESAVSFLKNGYSVSIAVKYDDKRIASIKKDLQFFVDLRSRFGAINMAKRIINKFSYVFKRQDHLLNAFRESNAELI